MTDPEAIALPANATLLPVEESWVSINWDRVRTHLGAHGLSLDHGFQPRQFAGGLANINLLLRIDGAFAVLRRPPEGPIPKGAHDMAREHRVLEGLAPVFPLAPRSLHYCDDSSVAGAPFQILEYRDGRLVRGDRLSPLDDTPEIASAVSRMLIETLVSVHAVDTEAAGLGGLGRPEQFLARTGAGWIKRAHAILDGQLSAGGRAVVSWLNTNPPAECDRPTLLHNDFKLDNLLLDAERIEPVALLDWDMATRGDPLWDLACLLGYWTEPGDPPGLHALRQMPSVRPGFLTRSQAANLYSQLSGRELDGFRHHRVIAMFRQGVVFHQLRKLAVNNPRLRDGIDGIEPDAFFDIANEIAMGRSD